MTHEPATTGVHAMNAASRIQDQELLALTPLLTSLLGCDGARAATAKRPLIGCIATTRRP
jgi:hypothetical protein